MIGYLHSIENKEKVLFAKNMRACKFGRVRRLFWDWVPRDHKNGSIFSYL